MTYQRIRDDEDKDLGQDEASEPIQSTDDSFRVCGCMDTAADRIGFAIREGRRYGDGGIAWYVRLQGQGETGLYNAPIELTHQLPGRELPLHRKVHLSHFILSLAVHT